MEKWSTIGLILLVAGVIIWIAYGLSSSFDIILEEFNYITGFIVGLIIVGVVILIVSIVIEQGKDTKKMKEEIKKEDLEP